MAEILTKNQVYNELINYHGLNWLKNYQDFNSIRYLEIQAGPMLSYFIKERGPTQVMTDLDIKIEELTR